MFAKRRNSSMPASGTAKKPSTVTLTSYLDGCVEDPDIFFVAGEPGQMQVTFPAHTFKFETLPAGSYLQGIAGMPSDEPVLRSSGVTADGFCNLLCVLYGKEMALSRDNWHGNFVTYVKLNMTETVFEAQLLAFAKRHMTPAMALACLGTFIGVAMPPYKSPLEEICWERIDRDGDAAFKSPNFWDSVASHPGARLPSNEQGSRCLRSRGLVGHGESQTEKLDFCLSRFKKDATPQGFVLRKRVETKKQNPSVVEGCKLCGHSEDAFIRCCRDMCLRVPKEAWSKAHCRQKNHRNVECEGVAYRCRCGAVNLERKRVRATECEQCGLGIHYCVSGVRRLSKFRKGEECGGCEEVPVADDDPDDDSQ